MCLVAASFRFFSSCRSLQFLLIAGFWWSSIAHAQPRLSFGSYSIDDGLSSYSISDIVQDHQGFLWIGTRLGLNRFDGFSFKTYRNIPGDSTSLAADYVLPNALAVDAAGYIWIGTDGGLSRYDPYTDTFSNFPHQASSDSLFQLANFITGVIISADGKVWSSSLAGVFVNDLDGNLLNHFALESAGAGVSSLDPVHGLVEDTAGNIWAGGASGLARIAPASGDVQRFPAVNQIWSLLATSGGQIWAGSVGGLIYEFDPISEGVRLHRLFQDLEMPEGPAMVADLMEDEGVIWAGTYGGGLFRSTPEGWVRYVVNPGNPTSLPSNLVLAVYKDRGDVFWVGTWDGLAYVKPEKAFEWIHFESGENVDAIEVDVDSNGDLWIVSEVHGLIRQPANELLIRAPARNEVSSSVSKVSAVLKDRDGKLWIGTPGAGVFIHDPDSDEFTSISAQIDPDSTLAGAFIYDIFEDSRGRIWIAGLDPELALYEPEIARFSTFRHVPGTVDGIGSHEVWTVFEDREEQIWLGTIGGGLGLVTIDSVAAGEISMRYFQADASNPYSISSNNVSNIYQDSEGILWLSTLGGGLNRFDSEKGTFKSWNIPEGLVHENVACVLPDSAGNLWLPTMYGLSRFNPDTQAFNSYTFDDGLFAQYFSLDGCDIHEGVFYLAAREGIITFDPSAIKHNLSPPRALITEIEESNEPLVMDSSASYKKYLELEHDQNFLRFKFSSSDYAIPSKNRFQYMLEGVDPDWVVDDETKVANYPKLPSGAYTFKVKAANSDGVWSESHASLSVHIKTPIYEKWWFRAGIIGFIGLLAGLYYRDRYRQKKHLEETRQQIADDLHDDMSANLSAISIFLSQVKKKTELNDADRLHADMYLDAVKRMSENVRDVVWMANPGKDTLGALLERMQTTLSHLLLNEKYVFLAEDVNWETRLPMNLRRNLFLVHKEAIHNIVKHAKASNVDVRVWQRKRRLTIEIRDNGAGFDFEKANFGNGIFSMRRRADQANLEVNIESEPGDGTTILIEAEIT